MIEFEGIVYRIYFFKLNIFGWSLKMYTDLRFSKSIDFNILNYKLRVRNYV